MITELTFYFYSQNAIKECMDEIEVSIGMSLNGSSFQPQSQPQLQQPQAQQQQKVPTPSQVAASAPKVIYNSAPSTNSSSTTPTDVMDVAATAYCVY